MFISDITANKRNASPTHLSIITMGLGSNGKKVRYRLEKLTRTEVGIAAAHLQSNNTNDNNTNLGRPAIYVDANNVINKVGRLSVDPVARTAEFFKEFSAEGLILCPGVTGRDHNQSSKQTKIRHKESRTNITQPSIGNICGILVDN